MKTLFGSLCVSICLGFLVPNCVSKVEPSDKLIREIANAAAFVNKQSPSQSIADGSGLGAFIDSASRHCGKLLESAHSMDDTISCLVAYVYDSLNIGFDSGSIAMAAYFPYATQLRHKGSCVGVTLLCVALGERLCIPIVGVAAPGHVFMRIDNGIVSHNLEPNRHGYQYTDDEYRAKYAIAPGSWYTLKALTKENLVGMLWYDIGNSFKAAGNLIEAMQCYTKAYERFPGFAEALGNNALCRAALGDVSGALALLERAAQKRPDLENIYANLGTLYISKGENRKACSAFEEALQRDKKSASLWYGYALSLSGQEMRTQAINAVDSALALDSKYAPAVNLKSQLTSHEQSR